MNHYLKGIWGALVKNNGLKKIALTVVLLLVLALGLTLFIQPVKAFSVNVVSSSGYLDSVGGYHIYCEVQNLDTAPITGVGVTTTFYDSSNNIIAVNNDYSALESILPNLKAPFHVLLWDIAQNATQLGPRVDHYTLAVNYTLARTTAARPLGLRIASSNALVKAYGDLNITGEVENTGTTNSTWTKVFATLYDSDGKVVATEFSFPESSHTESRVLPPRQKSSFSLYFLSEGYFVSEGMSLAKSYVLTAESDEYESVEFSSLPLPPMPTPASPSASTTPVGPTPAGSTPVGSTSTPYTTSTTTPAPSSPPTIAQLMTVAWVPPPVNAAAATVVTAVAVGAVSVAVAAASNSIGASAGKAAEKTSDLISEGAKKWLSELASKRLNQTLDPKKGSPFLPTKAEALAYAVSLLVLTISFSYVKVADFTQILAVLPTILATAVIVGFVKTFSLVALARKLGVWTEQRLWYFGLAMFLITTFAFGIPFSSPSRSVYHSPQFTKRREGIVASVAIIVTLAFAALFFALLVSGFTLIGSTGLAMCIIMAFLDTFPVAPMNGKAIYRHSKAAWAALFAATLAVYVSWLILI